MSAKKTNLNGWIILFIIILVILYLVSFGKADFLTDIGDERKIKLAEKRKQLDNRYNRVQDILNRKKALKIKLETICKRVLFGVRLTLALILVGIVLIAYLRYKVPLLTIGEYFGLGALVFLLIGFVFIGGPASFFTFWIYVEKKLTLKIYGKYIDIDKHIDSHEKELKQIDGEKAGIANELNEIAQAENEITKILEEKNNMLP